MYSQNNEQQLIQDYFSKIWETPEVLPDENLSENISKFVQQSEATVLEIGSNDGKTFSNSLKVIEQGWRAILIEPSPKAFELLTKLHEERPNVSCYQLAILKATEDATTVMLNESGSHLPDGSDTSLVSSLIDAETERWRKENVQFNQVEVFGMNFNEFLNLLMDASALGKEIVWSSSDLYPIFDLISIDVEGLDYDVLTQIDLTKCKCRMLIVETNGKENGKYIDYATLHGMFLHEQNAENLIFVK